MIVGGTEMSMALFGDGSTVGPISSTWIEPETAVAAANGSGTGTMAGVDYGRVQALIAGDAPATEAERALLQQIEGILRSTVEAVTGLANEGARQARLGRDLWGNPLQGSEDHQYEARVLQLVNAERAAYGLQPLSYNRLLDAASEQHNLQQAYTGVMAHDGIGDGDPGSRIRATGFNRAWGENVATGQLSPEQVVAEWMASPGHRRNILDPNFNLLGVSYLTASNGRTYWAQSFGA